MRNKTLETLDISGCELGPEDGIALAGVLSSGCVELETLSLDVSNNDFGFTGINNRDYSLLYFVFSREYYVTVIFFKNII